MSEYYTNNLNIIRNLRKQVKKLLKKIIKRPYKSLIKLAFSNNRWQLTFKRLRYKKKRGLPLFRI
jgi:hypothetical protein